jgi:type II secretory pathway pseudopilin PulG
MKKLSSEVSLIELLVFIMLFGALAMVVSVSFSTAHDQSNNTKTSFSQQLDFRE